MTEVPEDADFADLLARRLIDAGYLDFDVDVVADIIRETVAAVRDIEWPEQPTTGVYSIQPKT